MLFFYRALIKSHVTGLRYSDGADVFAVRSRPWTGSPQSGKNTPESFHQNACSYMFHVAPLDVVEET